MKDIFLVSIGGTRYGVWKDKILSVRNISALHRIPLSPAKIAGVLIEDGEAVMLADLSECIGLGYTSKDNEGGILLMENGQGVCGFAVSGEIDGLSVRPELLFPLPDFLRTPVFDSCAVCDGIPVPIINIVELYDSVMKDNDESSADSAAMVMAQPMDASAVSLIRFLNAGRERYAASAEGIDDIAIRPGAITLLPNMPPYVQGVTFRDGRLLPVIDLSICIKRQRGAPDPAMLIARIGSETFGLLVDDDQGALPAHKVAIRPAPTIIRNPWMTHMVMRAGEPVPFLDLAIALSPASRAADEIPFWQRYTPNSRFPDQFFEQDVDVVEFSLLGERHALPKQEVEEVIAFKPCRTIEDVSPTVIGVAEHNGEILPVLDLAMMFGRRSLATPSWRMMLVSNGDFRALVITETVIKERRLAPDIHRAVPIHLPHDLMYGCYPDAEAVRLIFNVEAIAVHFENSLIQKFLPALSQEMRMMSAEAEPTPELNTSDMFEVITESHKIEPDTEQKYLSHAVFSPGKMPEEAITNEPTPMKQPMDKEYVDTDQIDPATTNLLITAKLERQKESEIFKNIQEGNTISKPELISEQTPEEIMKEPQGIDRSRKESERKVHANASAQVVSKQKSTQARLDAILARGPAISTSGGNRPSEQIRSEESAGSGGLYRLGQEVEQLRVSKVLGKSRASERTRRVAYGAIIAVLVTFLYFVGTFRQQDFIGSDDATRPAKSEQIQVQAERARIKDEVTKESVPQSNAEREQKATQKDKSNTAETLVLAPLTNERVEPPGTAQKPVALELHIPATMPVDTDVYKVQEGDTLWSISKRFTGSPLNYPRIAGENRIADPDLIFPGQRIRPVK